MLTQMPFTRISLSSLSYIMEYTSLAHGPPSPSCLQDVDFPYLAKVTGAVALDAHQPPFWTANIL